MTGRDLNRMAQDKPVAQDRLEKLRAKTPRRLKDRWIEKTLFAVPKQANYEFLQEKAQELIKHWQGYGFDCEARIFERMVRAGGVIIPVSVIVVYKKQ